METNKLKLIPYKHPILGYYFDWGFATLIDGALHIGKFAIKWNSKQPLRRKLLKVAGRRYAPDDVEPNMYIWLKFNISFAGGWGIALTYGRWADDRN